MNADTQAKIRFAKLTKATALYWSSVKTYGSESHALRALDCRSRAEAVAMLAEVQPVSVFKCAGEIIVQ